jgi:hypothetical protein
MAKEKHETAERDETKQPLDLSKGGLVWSIWIFTEAAVIIVCGILAIIYSGNDDIRSTVFKLALLIVGILLSLGGVFRILANFVPLLSIKANEDALRSQLKAKLAYDLVVRGSLELAIGVTLIVNYISSDANFISTLVTFFSVFAAIVFIVAGSILLLFAIGFLVSKLYRVYLPILEIILSVVLIGLGALIIIYMADTAIFEKVTLVIVGIMMVLGGIGMISDTIVSILARNAKKKAEATEAKNDEGDTAEANVVDATTADGKDKTAEEKKEDPATPEPAPKE